MGFLFGTAGNQSAAAKNRPSDALIKSLGCRACPLNRAKGLTSPKMEASGSDIPLIYILGESPDEIADQEGLHSAGPSGEFVRSLIPGRLRSRIRWSSTIHCHTEGDRDPDKIEVEACRPRVEKDIERTKPAAIFGLGLVPLSWADKPSGIELWRGRRFPIRVGSHVCWYYPMRSPAFILKAKKSWGKSDEEIAFGFDIRRALAEIDAGLPTPAVHTAEFARKDITCITGRSGKDLKYVLEFLDYAGTCEVAGVDYETQNLRPYNRDSVILTAAVSVEDETLSFAFRHPQAGWSDSDLKQLDKVWVRFLKSKARKISHNLSFETEWTCFFYGEDLARSVPWEDTMTQAFVLDERVGDRKPGALGLEFISLQHFGINVKRLTSGLNKERMSEEPLSAILPYNGIDAKYHRLNYVVQRQRIKDEGLTEVYEEKLRQVPTVVLTQLKGIPTDPTETIKLEREYSRKLADVKVRIQEMPEAKAFRRITTQQFNPGSSQDVIVVLRDVLKTREGQEEAGWSTNEAVLGKLDHPFAAAVLEFRRLRKLKSTYTDPFMPGSPHLYDGNVLHQNLGTTLTDTGRLQSEDPAMQNWPVRSAEGKRVRRQVKAPIMASFDYGQIDGRLIACGSRDPTYCRALWENYDIHAEWARRLALHHLPFIGGRKFLDDKNVMGKFRDKVKGSWTFALFYGAALRTTAGRFGVDESVVKPMYDLFWREFAGIKIWQEQLIKQFEDLGYVQMFGGLRRRAPLGRGQIVNTPIQGATNRVVMYSMNRLSEIGLWPLQANMQIHDDLTFCFQSEREYEDSAPRIIDLMLDVREFDWICVPLSIELKDGPTWADLKKVEDFFSHKRLGWPMRAGEFM